MVLLKKIYLEKESQTYFFNDGIKSTNLPKYYFTNFIDNRKSPIINFLKKERRRFLKKEVDIDNEYQIKFIEKNNEQLKVDEILKTTINRESIPIMTLCRLKSVSNPEVQFFFLDDLNGNYEVLFIDIYHLVLPAPDREHNEKYPNPKKHYEQHKNASYCMSNIFHK